MADLAGRQHGVIARRQLIDLGLGQEGIRRWLGACRLHRVHSGVYAVGHTALPPRSAWIAAVLACGEGAVLSHRSAAALWDLRSTARASVDVTALRRTRHKRPGIDVHRVRKLMPADTTRRDGIPVTTVARTMLDLAEVIGRRDLDRAFEKADRIGLLDMRAVEAVCRRNPGRHGLKQLRRITAMHRGEAPHTRSELERRFLELCHDTGLPRPAVNVVVAGFEVDAVWRKERLVVEMDGYAFHRTRSAFERDRVRDAALQLAGYRVLRVTHRRLEAAPTTVAETLRSMLAGLSLQQA